MSDLKFGTLNFNKAVEVNFDIDTLMSAWSLESSVSTLLFKLHSIPNLRALDSLCSAI